jgi:hypothetical protein
MKYATTKRHAIKSSTAKSKLNLHALALCKLVHARLTEITTAFLYVAAIGKNFR